MKNDKLLTELLKIESELLGGKEPSAYISLQNLITEVEGEIRDECNKENGKGSVGKAAERIYLSIYKTQGPGGQTSGALLKYGI